MRRRPSIMASITIIGIVFVFVQGFYLMVLYPFASTTKLEDVTHHACSRDCALYPESRTCAYEFVAEWYYSFSKACYDCPYNASDCERPHCMVLNGVQRPVLAINRQIPGPSIQVCQGDRIQVTVRNLLDNSEGLSIHWHGQHQRRSPHMDGTSMITSCPIPHPQSFTYDFVAETPGTQWWHSHAGLQRADGLFGPVIVRQKKSDDVHGDLYDVDDVDHVLMISDWTDVLALQHMMMDLHADGPGEPDDILLNGRGTNKVFQKNDRQVVIQSEVFTVTPGMRHRFRTINTAVSNCPVIVSVEHHTLVAIASDGAPFKPILVDGVAIAGGERYDFILQADQTIDNYWIRFQGVVGSECEGLQEKAILRYKGASVESPGSKPKSKVTGRILNLANADNQDTEKIVVKHLQDAEEIDLDIIRRDPDVTHYLEVDSVYRNSPRLHHHRYYPVEDGGRSYTAKRTHMLNNISFELPTAPLLSSHDQVPDHRFCTDQSLREDRGRDCATQHCACVHTIEIDLDQVVEIVLVTKSMKGFEPHPLHLHGNHFYVVGYDNGEQLPLETIKRMNNRGEIKKNLEHPPRKDTIMMANRYAILRFKATNPGWWLFHCHMDLHLELGMAVVLRVGGDEDIPPPPADLPVCVRDGQQTACGEPDQMVKSNSAARDINAPPPECASVSVVQTPTDKQTVLLYVAIPAGCFVSLACICLVSAIRKYTRDETFRYRTLTTDEFEMTASSL